MAKLKTHKATAKRFKITKNKKVLKRRAGQSHYNGKESGNERRTKRLDTELLNVNLARTVKTLMNQR